MKTLMQFYNRYKHLINRKIRKNISIHIQSTIVCHQVSQPAITVQLLLGLLAKRSLLFFGSQCLWGASI